MTFRHWCYENIFAFNYSLCILECRPCIWYNYTSDSLTRFAPGLIKFSFSPDIILLVLFASLNIQTVLYSSYYVCCWIYNCWFNWFRVFLETAILYSITCDFLVHFPASPDELFDSYKFTNVMYPRFLLKFVSNRQLKIIRLQQSNLCIFYFNLSNPT